MPHWKHPRVRGATHQDRLRWNRRRTLLNENGGGPPAGGNSFKGFLDIDIWSNAPSQQHDFSLSGDSITIASNGIVNGSITPVIPIYSGLLSGKYYYEVVYDVLANNPSNDNTNVSAGWARTDGISSTVDSSVASGTDGLTFIDDYETGTIDDGQIQTGLPSLVNSLRITQGDVLGVVIDFDGKKVWYNLNGTYQGPGTQDPDTNAGGFWMADETSVSVVGMDLFLYYGPWAAVNAGPAVDNQVTMRFGSADWTLTVPSGFDNEIEPFTAQAGMNETAWSPSEAAEVVFSTPSTDMALIRRASGQSGSRVCRFATARNTGKYYVEATVLQTNASTGADFGMGLIETDATLASTLRVLGINMTSEGFFGQYNINDAFYGSTQWASSVDARTANDLGRGDIMMMAVDFDNGYIWYGLNGTWYNSGDPTDEGVTGASIEAATGSGLWQLGQSMDLSTPVFMWNGGGMEFRHTPPAGFVAWETA